MYSGENCSRVDHDESAAAAAGGQSEPKDLYIEYDRLTVTNRPARCLLVGILQRR